MRKSLYLLTFMLAIIIGACKEDPPVVPDTTIGPEVKIAWPLNGTNVLDTTYITIDATDDKKVTKVEIFIDNINNESMTMTIEPFRVTLYAEYYDPATPHTIIAKAYDEDGNVNSSEEVTINTFQFQPTNLIATLTSDTSVTLRWRDNSNVETGFEIEWKPLTGNWTHLTFVDSNITTTSVSGVFLSSETYSYRIRAFNVLGNSTFSEIDTARIIIPVPVKLKLTPETKTSVEISWEDKCNYETSYKIERSENSASFIEIGQVALNQTSFIVTMLDTLQTYRYRVQTITTHNKSGYSSPINSDFLLSGVPLRFLSEHTGTVRAGVISRDNQFAITSADDKTIKIYKINDGTLVRNILAHDLPIYCVTLSPDGSIIASASEDRTIKLWRLSDGSLIRTLNGHSLGVLSIRFNSNGTQLVSGGKDAKVILWNVSDGSLIDSLMGHTSFVYNVRFTPDDQRIVSSNYDRTIKVWNSSEGTQLANLTGHIGGVFGMDVSPDGQMIASVSNDRTLKYWNLNNYSLIRSVNGHSNAIFAAAFTPEGSALATSGADSFIKLWNSQNGVLMSSLSMLAESINFISFSDDSQMMITGGTSQTAIVWGIGYQWSMIQ